MIASQPALLEPDRLVDGGRRGDDLRPGGAHPVEEWRVGQAEVEADDLRAQLLDERAEGGVERRAVAGRGRRRRVEPELAVVGREPGLPRRLAPGVGRGRAVAEEVDVDRPVGPLADDAELGAEALGVEQRAGQRAEAAGLGDRDRHVGEHRAGHRRLDDRQLDAEEVEDAPVGPHRGHMTAPTCQGTNSLSPRPSASLLVFSPEATCEHLVEDLAALRLDRDAGADDVAAVDVHVVGHLREEPVVGRDLDRRRGLRAEGRAAAGGEDHDLGAAGDLAGRRDRVVAGGVHEDEAGLGDGLGVLVDGGQRRRAALGGGAERLLEDGGQAALLVAGRGVVVHRAAVDRGVALPPADALDQLVGDLGAGGAAQQQLLGAVDLRGLGEDRGAAHADEQVGGGAERGVGGDAGEAVGAAALQGEAELGGGDGLAGGPVHLGQAARGSGRRSSPRSWWCRRSPGWSGRGSGRRGRCRSATSSARPASPRSRGRRRPRRRRSGGWRGPRARAAGCRSPAPRPPCRSRCRGRRRRRRRRSDSRRGRRSASPRRRRGGSPSPSSSPWRRPRSCCGCRPGRWRGGSPGSSRSRPAGSRRGRRRGRPRCGSPGRGRRRRSCGNARARRLRSAGWRSR